MDSISYVVTVALIALAPHLGEARAKEYGEAVARAAQTAEVDPWMLVAIARVETNWNTDNIGECCGGLMSIHWTGWQRYAERYGLGTDRHSLETLARDGTRSIQVAANVLASMRRMCGTRSTLVLGAYQSGTCRANTYGRQVSRIASHYRHRYAAAAVQLSRVHRPSRLLPGVAISLGRPGATPLAMTQATTAAGP